jgi:hypothetical protein
LQKACGTGGTVKEGRIEIQGDKRAEVARILSEAGFRPVFAGRRDLSTMMTCGNEDRGGKPRSACYCKTWWNLRSLCSTITRSSIWPKETEVRKKKSGSRRKRSQRLRPRPPGGAPDGTPMIDRRFIAQEITDDLEAAREQFATIAEDLKE